MTKNNRKKGLFRLHRTQIVTGIYLIAHGRMKGKYRSRRKLKSEGNVGRNTAKNFARQANNPARSPS